jgi:hypothetical protein
MEGGKVNKNLRTIPRNGMCDSVRTIAVRKKSNQCEVRLIATEFSERFMRL